MRTFPTFGAVLVHLLTASGILCTLAAFIAINNHSFDTAYLWLGLALVIDAVDGPLARFVDTEKHLPRFSGERLDLIIDYLNYVVLPALIVITLPVIDGAMGIFAAALILMTSLFHFSDTASKTSDGYFVGFPAIWNVVIFYFLAFNIDARMAFMVIIALSLLTFIPVRFVHPFRVEKMRVVTIIVVLASLLAALLCVLKGFNGGLIENSVLITAPAYLFLLGLMRNLHKFP